VTGRHDHAAEVLHQQEFSRLSDATVPTLESLRFLNPQQLRARVAGMLERLGYELLTPETAKDLLVGQGFSRVDGGARQGSISSQW
jgi:hypothetical protein